MKIIQALIKAYTYYLCLSPSLLGENCEKWCYFALAFENNQNFSINDFNIHHPKSLFNFNICHFIFFLFILSFSITSLGIFFFFICQQHGIRLYDPVRECTESGHRYLSTGIKTQSSRLSVSKQFNIVSFHDLTIIQEHNYLSLLDFVRHLIAWFCSFCHLKPVLSAYSWELSQQLAYFREKKNLYSNISFCHHR